MKNNLILRGPNSGALKKEKRYSGGNRPALGGGGGRTIKNGLNKKKQRLEGEVGGKKTKLVGSPKSGALKD